MGLKNITPQCLKKAGLTNLIGLEIKWKWNPETKTWPDRNKWIKRNTFWNKNLWILKKDTQKERNGGVLGLTTTNMLKRNCMVTIQCLGYIYNPCSKLTTAELRKLTFNVKNIGCISEDTYSTLNLLMFGWKQVLTRDLLIWKHFRAVHQCWHTFLLSMQWFGVCIGSLMWGPGNLPSDSK